MTFAFAAAGTGGHVYPALAVADALVRRGVAATEIVFYGGDRMEADVVPAAGYAFVGTEIRGLRRAPTPKNLTLPGVVNRAARRVGEDMEARRVGAMIVFGGYVAVPAGIAARRRQVPLFAHEQNAVPGMANRFVSRWAARTYVAFPAATSRLRNGVVVGNPLREGIVRFNRGSLRRDALARYGLDGERPVLGVLGGSLGALTLNEIVMRLNVGPGDRAHDTVHITGPGHHADIVAAAAGDPQWAPVGFEGEMEYFYAASDVVLSRAGALTVSELAATGTPAVVVPLPAGKGYQARNAEALAAVGGCIVISQDDPARVQEDVGDLLGDPDERERMAKAAASVAHPDAADVIAADLIEAHRG